MKETLRTDMGKQVEEIPPLEKITEQVEQIVADEIREVVGKNGSLEDLASGLGVEIKIIEEAAENAGIPKKNLGALVSLALKDTFAQEIMFLLIPPFIVFLVLMSILYQPECSTQEFFIAAGKAGALSLGSTAGALFAFNLKRRATGNGDGVVSNQSGN